MRILVTIIFFSTLLFSTPTWGMEEREEDDKKVKLFFKKKKTGKTSKEKPQQQVNDSLLTSFPLEIWELIRSFLKPTLSEDIKFLYISKSDRNIWRGLVTSIYSKKHIKNKDFHSIMKLFPYCTTLEQIECCVPGNGRLKSAPQIETLFLSPCPIIRDRLSKPQDCKDHIQNLEKNDTLKKKYKGGKGLKYLSLLTNLHTLNMSYWYLIENGYTYFSGLNHLTELRMSHCNMWPTTSFFSHLTNLEILTIQSDHYFFYHAPEIFKLTNLRELKLSSYHNHSFRKLPLLEKLVRLSLPGDPPYEGNFSVSYSPPLRLNKEDLQHLANLTNLTSLDLSLRVFAGKDEDLFKPLSGLTKLRELDLYNSEYSPTTSEPQKYEPLTSISPALQCLSSLTNLKIKCKDNDKDKILR